MDINQAWKETCQVVLGGEVGELGKFEHYLSRYVEPVYSKKSALSGRPVTISISNFGPRAKFISNDEQEEYEKLLRSVRLDVNAVKDLDSLAAALGEHLYYAGNQVTGNSSDVRESDNVIDSHHVWRSAEVWGGKYVARSSMARGDEYIFGVNWSGNASYCINCYETYKQSRCLETLSVWTSSDCYYSARLEGCADCLFSFNQKNKHHLIGNRPFSKEEYSKHKQKLLGDLRERLRSTHDAPSIINILGGMV